MLRARNRGTTGSTGVALTLTHALGTIPDVVTFTPTSGLGQDRTYMAPGARSAAVVHVVNSIESTVTVDVTCLAYQGRLY